MESRACGSCAYFRNNPAYLEMAFKGLASFSSGWASVRGDDGLCLRHDRYLGAKASCADFEALSTDCSDVPTAAERSIR
jgi:hypothetical protein